MLKMLFIHGAGGNGSMWAFQQKRFSDADAVTLPGHPEGPLPASIERYRDWLRGHVEGKKYGRVVLVGHSMGGGIALAYALAYPGEVGGLVLIASGARLRVNPDFLKMLSNNVNEPPSWYRTMALPMYKGVDPSVRDKILERHCAVPISVHLNDFLCCDRFDVMDRLAEIHKPALMICGDRDIMTPVKYSRFLNERIAGSRLAVIPGAGHLVYLEKPEAVNAEIEAFLRAIER